MKTLIRNATVLTMDKEMHIYSPGYVLTVDETIKELGTRVQLFRMQTR